MELATKYLEPIIQDEKLRNNAILQCWSTVHGMTHLTISGIIRYEDSIEMVVEEMLRAMGFSGMLKKVKRMQ